MVTVQYDSFLTNIIASTKIYESEAFFKINFVNLPKRVKAPLMASIKHDYVVLLCVRQDGYFKYYLIRRLNDTFTA